MYSRENVIGIIGAPNSGKTTLFNWITGSKFRAVNYPGSTVECYTGESLDVYGNTNTVTDTPGTYSLFPQSPDEEVTCKILFEDKKFSKLIVVVDATQMARHFYIVQQVKETGYPFIVALTMNDVIKKEQLEIDVSKLAEKIGAPVVLVDGVLGGGVKELLHALQKIPSIQKDITKLSSWSLEKINFITTENEKIAADVLKNKKTHLNIFKRTAKIDSILLHPIFGYFIFAVVMMTLFSSIFWIATPFMDWVDGGFSTLADSATQILGENLLSDLIANGVIASFASVFVFVPQIFILFFILGFLEDSGYLARASTLIDKPFSKAGMNGRSFVPVLSGFACAIPALMAARTLGSKKERLITQFIIPLMTCSARLPVYALLLAFLFYGKPAWQPGLALTALYIIALLVGMLAAAILNKILKTDSQSMFLMELPMYRAPKIRVILKNALLRTQSYIKRAGPVIFVIAVIIWGASTFPNYQAEDSTQKLETSYLGQTGQALEPIFKPMGVDWRAGIGMLTAFAAREVFVSTLAVMYNISEDTDEETMQTTLLSKMQEATFESGERIFTPATVIGLLIFFMIALQCMTTVATAAKESGSWKFAIIQLVALNLAAYGLAVLAVQGLRAMGIA